MTTGMTHSVAGLTLDSNGGIVACIVATDQESFHSALRPVPDISVPMTGAEIPAIYQGAFWLTDIARAPSGAFFACDADGSVHDNSTGEWTVTAVSPGAGLRTIAFLDDGTILTGGTSGCVYRRRADGTYEALDPELGSWISSIAGRGRDAFVAVGDGGSVLEWSDGAGRKLELARSGLLHAVIVDGDDYLAVGEKGQLWRRRGDAWKVQRTGAERSYFDVALYGGATWVAAGKHGVAEVNGKQVTPVRETFHPTRVRTEGRFAAFAAGGILARYDGAAWFGYKFG